MGILYLGLEQNLATCNLSWEHRIQLLRACSSLMWSAAGPPRSDHLWFVWWAAAHGVYKELGHNSATWALALKAEQVRVYCCDSGEEIFLRLVWLPGSISCCSAPPSLASIWMGSPSPGVSSFLSLWQHSSAIAHVSAQTSPPPPGSLPWFSKAESTVCSFFIVPTAGTGIPCETSFILLLQHLLVTHLPSSLDCVLLNTSLT